MVITALAFGILLQTQHGKTKAKEKPYSAPVQKLRPGQIQETIEEDKTSRTYIVHVPASYTGRVAVPLVIVLHGWTSSGKDAAIYTEMARESDSGKFIAVFPNGLGKPQGWNCGFLNLGGKGADDVKFLTDVIHTIEKEARIDRNRVYICGHSNGGFMTYAMGSALGKELAAIGVVEGTIGLTHGDKTDSVKPPTSPVSAIIIHGLKDRVVWSGSSVPALLQNAVPPMKCAEFWAKAIGIQTEPSKTQEPNDEVYDWKGHNGQEVRYVAVTNGTHDWPGGYGSSGPETASGVNAAQLIWDFFKSHPRR